jgi:hypothetical protein
MPVHEGPVGAGVHQHKALLRRDDLRVAPRHLVTRHHDVAARVAADDQRGADLVLASVGETHQTTAGHHGRCRRLGAAGRGELFEGGGIEELRVAGAARIDNQELVRTDLDLVAVQHGGRLVSLVHPVHQDVGVG